MALMQRFAGILLAIGGVGFFLAGAFHPAGSPGQSFHAAIVSMLGNPMWPIAHWCALTSAFLTALALSLLLDKAESATAAVGVRLGLIASVFMAVEFAVELAARSDVARYASGETTPIVSLIDAMQAVGFPALALAFILIATGTRWAPRWVIVLGVVGAVALAVGGLVVQGLHVVALGPAFLVGNLLPVWMVWAGVRLAREGGSPQKSE
jgi:hypothetical protein